MYKDVTILAIIPAKGKSSRLPNKNICLFAGKPLITWTIREALRSRYLDKIVVSTDDKKIAQISEDYGAEVPFLRPKKLSRDSISAMDVARYTLKRLKKTKQNFGIVVILQPTSPLRTAKHIDSSIAHFFKKNAEYLVGITKIDKPIFWLKVINKNGLLKDYFSRNTVKKIKNKQLYIPNGAIYLIKTNALLYKNLAKFNKTIYYYMDNFVSVDIDTQFEFKIAELLMFDRTKKESRSHL